MSTTPSEVVQALLAANERAWAFLASDFTGCDQAFVDNERQEVINQLNDAATLAEAHFDEKEKPDAR